MDTPNKIYIADNVFPTHVDWDGSPINTKRIESSDIEYLRKDALLEWAKEQKKECEQVIREHPEDESLWCERDKYDELIDKLNSM